jgi:hypothetical protein
MSVDRPLIVACGALVQELRAVLGKHSLNDDIEVRYLPANLHNRPEGIVPALRPHLEESTERTVFVAYADCGTGGALDRLLEEFPRVQRLAGAHCYEFFAGSDFFHQIQDEEPGTFYLTDFLAKHFEALVWQGLGLDRHPELRDAYFGAYKRVVLFSQSQDPAVEAHGRRAAEMLGLEFEHRHVGLQAFEAAIPVQLLAKSGAR